MVDLNRIADLLMPGLRSQKMKLEQVSDYLDQIIETLRKNADKDNWQPIETAPMDIHLLLYEPECSIFIGTGSLMSWDNSVYWCGDGTPQRYPTYWMPLPEPPK